ncbi:MAG: ThiF family adenylyltransferase, partial [Alphaproteobacteria bacterium]|nr:ThiF family adenylyltransferase [Alphaproteobacteria bacterium]
MHNINKLNNEEIERYSRQIILPQIGGAGQQKLKATKILIIGAGGLGAPVLQYLSAAGIGELGIVDDDYVELSNLQRQIIHRTDSIGQAKTKSAYEAIQNLNPNTKITNHSYRLESGNAQELFAAYDIIIDCCDNFATHYLTADTAQIMHKPCISGAINQFDGMITVLMPYKDQN